MMYRLVMTERPLDGDGSALAAARRQFAEDFGVVGERVGMPRMTARLLGWMLICDPPRQSMTDLVHALGVSRASVSISTRLLQATGLLRRVGEPGSRGHHFELDPAFFAGQMNAANPFGMLRAILDEGVGIAGGELDPRAARLREARDFYAFVEHAIPDAIERYRAQRGSEGRDTSG
jgi:MarR family